MVTNPVYYPGDGTIEEMAKEQSGENVGYSEIKDVLSIVKHRTSTSKTARATQFEKKMWTINCSD